MIFVHTLGTAQIDVGETRVKPGASRRFAMLLYLASEPGRRVSRTALHELIWPDQAEKNARHSVREVLYQLRQAGVAIKSDVHSLELAAEAVHSDYGELLGMERPEGSHLKAVEGGFLPGYAPTHSEAYAEWLESFRSKRVFELCRAILREVTRAKAGGDWAKTELAARACLALDPLNEEATLALAEMLAIGGAKVQAVKLLDDYAREVGTVSALGVPASILKRRISERFPATYSAGVDLPFAGRQLEFSTLVENFEGSRASVPRCVMVVGEPGIGKTRLVSEFSSFVSLRSASVHTARMQSHDVHRPLSAVLDLLPSLLEAPGALGSSPNSLCLLRLLADGGAHRANLLASKPSSEAFFETIAAITELIDAVAAELPLVLVVEDIHWLDSMSLAVLADMVCGRTKRRLLLVLTSRHNDRFESIFRHAEAMSIIELDGLAHDVVSQLVESRLRDLALGDDEASGWICGAANGNPLFVTMLIAHLRDTGIRFEAPPTLLSLLAARVRRLTPLGRSLLVLASLLSRNCTLSRLTAAAEMGSLDLMNAAGELEQMQLVRVVAGEFRPLHALVVDAVLAEAPELSVIVGHRRIAALLEAEVDFATPALLWDSAEHWVAGGEVTKGVALMRRCADHSDSIGRPREAAEALLRASTLATPQERREMLLDALRASAKGGEHDVVLRATERLRSDGWTPSHDELELAEITAAAVWHDDVSGGDQLLTCIADPNSSEEHRKAAALALLRVANSARDRHLADQALVVLTPVFRDTDDSSLFRVHAMLLYHVCFGDFREASHAAEVVARLGSNVSRYESAALRFLSGLAFARDGQTDRALKIWKEAFDEAQASGLSRRQFDVAQMAMSFATDAGLTAAAAEWSKQVERLCATFPEFRETLYRLSFDSDIAAARQDLRDLRECYRRAKRRYAHRASGRVQRWLHALELQIELLSRGIDAPQREIGSLVDHHRRGGESGDASDLEVATAIRIAISAKDFGTARRVLRTYLAENRQNISPLWSSLTQAARSAGLLEEATSILEDRRRGWTFCSTGPEPRQTPISP